MVKRDFTGLLLAGILFLTGCGSQSLTYNANLGYDFSKMEYANLFSKYIIPTRRITDGKRLRKCRALLQKATLQI